MVLSKLKLAIAVVIVHKPPIKKFAQEVQIMLKLLKLIFDEKVITYEEILKIFFEIHDPTTLNSQGPDFGTQYRSEIFYLNDNQKKIAEDVLDQVNKKLSGKVVTKISLLKNYCVAEEYHQKYLEKR